MLTHTTPISILSLPNVLHVPKMTKNLISVSQLTNENNVIAEFHSTFCLIKDKDTGLVLFRGVLKDGLYQLNPALACAQLRNVSSSSTISNSYVVTSKRSPISFVSPCNRQNLSSPSLKPSCNNNRVCKQWHDRLSYPSLHVLKHVLNKIHVSCHSNNLFFCDSCKLGKLHQLPFASCSITTKHPLELIYSDL